MGIIDIFHEKVSLNHDSIAMYKRTHFQNAIHFGEGTLPTLAVVWEHSESYLKFRYWSSEKKYVSHMFILYWLPFRLNIERALF